MKKVLIITIALVISIKSVYAQNIEDKLLSQLSLAKVDTQKVNLMIDLFYYYTEIDYVKSQDFAEKTLDLSKSIGYEEGEAQGYFGLGLAYDHFGEYEKALEYYIKSLTIFDKLNDYRSSSSVYTTVGIFFRKRKNYDQAIEYYLKAVHLDSIYQRNIELAGNYNNIGNIYADLNEAEKTMEYYQKSLALYEAEGDLFQMAAIKVNLGIQYEENGDFKKAENLFIESYKISHEIQDLKDIMIASTNLGFNYVKQKEFDKAKRYLFEAQEICDSLKFKNWRENLLEGWILYATEQGNFQEAYEYQKELIMHNDSLYDIAQQNTIEELQARFENEQKEKKIIELQKEQSLQNKKRWNLIIILAVSILSGIFLFFWQRTKLLKERKIAQQKKQILDAQNKQLALEREKIQQELEFRDKELSTFALHLVQKNDFLTHIEKIIKQVSAKSQETKKALKDISLELHHNKLIGKDLVDFQARLDLVNNQFFELLEKKFPTMTKNEKRLAALLRLDLSTKEISVLNHVSEQAVKMSRHRLRKKLNMDSKVNLTDFFKKI
ncbi:MAG: tetratricopeptide repeat protein [Flavobacteriales bacterium]|jgi:tetratricopeptide (TPR) repeat protein/DNA-binding CsgD family transcriptional regulator|nr:tetratricopeptide repeat protein [Flavobacteriales bacterium]